MKHKEKIDAILDDRKKGYALAWLEKSHGYPIKKVTVKPC